MYSVNWEQNGLYALTWLVIKDNNSLLAHTVYIMDDELGVDKCNV